MIYLVPDIPQQNAAHTSVLAVDMDSDQYDASKAGDVSRVQPTDMAQSTTAPAGVAAKDMGPAEAGLLMGLVQEYVGRMPEDVAGTRLDACAATAVVTRLVATRRLLRAHLGELAEEVHRHYAVHYLRILEGASLLYQRGGENRVRGLRLFDLNNQVCFRPDLRRRREDEGACFLVLIVENRAPRSGAGLNKYPMAGLAQRGYAAGNKADPRFVVFDFLWNTNDHGSSFAGVAVTCEFRADNSRFGPSPRPIKESESSFPVGVNFCSC